MPYTLPGEPTHSGITRAALARPDAAGLPRRRPSTVRRLCPLCALDTIAHRTRRSSSLDLSPGGDSPTVLPGTDFASGVSAGAPATRSTTRWAATPGCTGARSRPGDETVVHDFGAAGIARDVHVAGEPDGGGRRRAGAYVRRSEFGPVQRDSGGVVHVVDLASGADVALDGPGRALPPARALARPATSSWPRDIR